MKIASRILQFVSSKERGRPSSMVKQDHLSSMLSLSVFGSIRAPMKSQSDAKLEAVTFMGLLRHNEDQLVEKTKVLMKNDRAFVQEMFATRIDEWTPLHACTLRGARRLVKVALKSGIDPNLEMGAPDGLPGNCTPLHLAAYRGDVSILQLLVQHGAHFNARDNKNKTPLHYAVSRNNTLAARKLLKYGADFSELTAEEKIYYKEDIATKGSALLCIPVRVGSQKHRNGTAALRYKPSPS